MDPAVTSALLLSRRWPGALGALPSETRPDGGTYKSTRPVATEFFLLSELESWLLDLVGGTEGLLDS